MKQFTLFIIGCIFSIGAVAEDSNAININYKAEYYDTKVIPSNIINKCTNLGYKFSDSTKRFLEKNGFDVAVNADFSEQAEGLSLKLSIINAVSAGNAWTGHRKSVSIQAELFENGELQDTFNNTRNSGGGFGAGFKGSCSVLERCAHTLGKDVAAWLAKNHRG